MKLVISNFYEKLLCLIIFSTLFFPNFLLPGGGTYMVDLILLTIFAPIIFVNMFRNKDKTKYPFVLFCILLVFQIFSLLHGYAYLGVPFNSLDIWAIYTLNRYVILISLATLANSKVFFKYFERYIPVCIFFLVIVCFFEYFNIGGSASKFGTYYSSELHIDSMLSGANRIVATGRDPNVGASIICFMLLYITNRLTFTDEKKNTLINIVLFFALFTSLFFTSSRTLLIGVVFVLFFTLLFVYRVNIIIKILAIAILSVSIILMLPYFDYLFYGLLALGSVEGNSSLNTRFDMWGHVYEQIKLSPILGWGPAIAIHDPVVDGDYFFMTRRFGLIGIALYFGIITHMIVGLFKTKNSNVKYNFYKLYILQIFVLSLIIMMTNSFYMGTQLFSLFIALLTVLYVNKNNKQSWGRL